MPGLLHPRPWDRIVRAAPGVLDVAGLDQRPIGLLPTRRRDIEALTRLHVTPGGEHMHVNAAIRLAVPHRRPSVPIRLQPGPGGLLELVEHPVDVRVARRVLWSPGDHARRVPVLELQRVSHHGHLVRVAAQHRHVVPDLALAVRLAREVGGRRLGRAGPTGARNLISIARVPHVQLRQCPLDGDQVRDDLDGRDVTHVGVRPARNLIQVRANARHLPGARALEFHRRRGPRLRPRHRLPQ